MNMCCDGEALQTLTKSTSILMSHPHNRWLTAKEMLSVQGFPVTTVMTAGAPCSSYALRWMNKARGLPYDPWPSRHALCEHAGDSMHTSCSGLVFLYAMTQVIQPSDILRVQHYVFRQTRRNTDSDDDDETIHLQSFRQKRLRLNDK